MCSNTVLFQFSHDGHTNIYEIATIATYCEAKEQCFPGSYLSEDIFPSPPTLLEVIRAEFFLNDIKQRFSAEETCTRGPKRFVRIYCILVGNLDCHTSSSTRSCVGHQL